MKGSNVMIPPEGAARTRANIEKAADAVYLPEDGTVVELRVFGEEHGWKKIYSGWFEDRERFVAEAERFEKAGYEVFATLNPCPVALLARGYNEMRPAKSAGSTNDTQILSRRWLVIDWDPRRESGISATDEEKAKALELARRAREDLAERGIPSILCDSGNGAHLLIPIDLPNTPASLALVSGVLKAVGARYANEDVEVDQTVANAARIMKVYGTTARKGDSVERIGRVHRQSAILEVPESLEPVEKALLERSPERPPRKKRPPSPAVASLAPMPATGSGSISGSQAIPRSPQ
jgi:hypothetical protein